MIVNRIYDWASKQPDKTAIIQDDEPISYAEFANAIDAARRFLARHELRAGTTAVVLVEHLTSAWFTVLALRSLGLTTICVQSLAEAEQLGIQAVGAVVTTPQDVASQRITRRRALGRLLIVMPDTIWWSPPAGPLTPIDDPDRPYGGHILYTSGTTGTYKKVLKPGQHEAAQVRRCVVHRRIEPSSIVHMLYFGLWSGVGYKQALAAWWAGATVVIDQTPDVLRSFFKHTPSFASLTPQQAQDLLVQTATIRRPAKMPIVNLVGGFTSEQLISSLRKAKFDDLMINYGSTECSHVLRSYVEDDDRVAWLAPAADRRVEVVDDDDRACAPGQEGRLRVALLDHDAQAYLDNPAASADVFSDGWFYPGDVAVRREDGRIRILGRAGDVLNVGGQKIATGPLEAAVRQLTGVQNVCLFQSVDVRGVEELVIVLEADALPAKAVIDHVAARFQGFDRVRFEAIERFPRTSTGLHKVQRLELRKMVLGTDAS
jgi:acyl-coenzyme A synthetase/AMP-(fatty) acid ligase